MDIIITEVLRHVFKSTYQRSLCSFRLKNLVYSQHLIKLKTSFTSSHDTYKGDILQT